MASWDYKTPLQHENKIQIEGPCSQRGQGNKKFIKNQTSFTRDKAGYPEVHAECVEQGRVRQISQLKKMSH